MAIAKTLVEIHDDPVVATSLDTSKPVIPLVEKIMAAWKADLSKRRPAPAYIEGEDGVLIYQGTDLDLFSVLMALSQRNAVINIPEYENARVTSLSSNHYVVAKTNRHGQIERVVGNKETHAFSAMIVDFNVVEVMPDRSERVGFPRNFWVMSDAGEFYDRWKKLEWRSTPEEEGFIQERKLEAYKDTIEFQFFVHPALATSLYGRRYLQAKALAARIDDEASHYRALARKLESEGIALEEVKPVYSKKGSTETVKVRNLEAKLVLPMFNGEYQTLGIEEIEEGKKPILFTYDGMPDSLADKQRILRYAEWWSNQLSFKYGQLVRAPVRAVELAFFLYGLTNKEPGNEVKPGWAAPEWQREYVEPGKRVQWNTLRWNMLEFNPHVKILYRIRETAAEVRVRG